MKISPDVLGVLSRFSFTPNGPGFLGKITDGQLDRKLYVGVNKVLEELGGKWNRKAGGHLFFNEISDRMEDLLQTGRITDSKKELGFFETPVAVAARLAREAEVRHGMSVLEPEAGTGRLADAVRESVQPGFALITCVELDCERYRGLLNKGYFEVFNLNFLETVPDSDGRYDRVVMNPPFARRQDIHHVRHAFRWLKAGGVLAAIMSGGVVFREDKLALDFRHEVDAADGTIIPLPEGSFSESGTEANTCIVTMRK